MEDEKAVNVQVLLDQLIRNVLIALDRTRQTSAEQLVENAMGATNWVIIYGSVQATKKAALTPSMRKTLQAFISRRLTKLQQLLLKFAV